MIISPRNLMGYEMNFARKLVAAAVVAVACMMPAFAGEFDNPIKARKAIMQLYAWNIGILGRMAKGVDEYNVNKAEQAALNLMMLSNLSDREMWPPGSDSTALPDQTRAKAAIWASNSAGSAEIRALAEAAAQMSAVAGNGLTALQDKMKNLGEACASCHKSFREEE